MLKDVENQYIMSSVWPRFMGTYRIWCHRMAALYGPAALGQAKGFFLPHILRGEILTTTWAVPSNWRGTTLQPLYGTLQDVIEAAKFMGLVACDAVLDHVNATGQNWCTMHCEKEDGALIHGRTYWRVYGPLF
jgi:hypothetical protein